ncbi:hypothetical protein HELRODRAFT_116577 [Helobdella robusta]|uniref:PLD phosphodiesterase domain-containing protein n=1 Tax=Helobdella robusta TaxID=6412 RepID=T1EGG2_HELRO|nr:hypothetical protein HELRODRAFT_116577 [Helobdella robusta]ESN90181.1 hypothetical protein HELRODRAFT_116577 [Helobdella robusta]
MAYFTVGLITMMALILLLLPIINQYLSCPEIRSCDANDRFSCSNNPPQNCSFQLVETIPENLTYPSGSIESMSTFDAWMFLLKNAKKSVDLISFYWLMMDRPETNSSLDIQGKTVFNELLNVIKRGVKLRIIVNKPNTTNPDLLALSQAGAEVLNLEAEKLLKSGVLHTKLWLVDGQMLYLGSANMDWRSLTQVKELGILIKSCDLLLSDASKLVDLYNYVASRNEVPRHWPCKFNTRYNADNPMQLNVQDQATSVFLSSSPPFFCPSGRTSDINAILNVIHSAKQFVHISVMDYMPYTEFAKPHLFWPVIDDALRRVAVEKKIEVKILTSLWKHTKPDMLQYMKSLASLNGLSFTKPETSLQAKLFCVPVVMPYQQTIPYARVNHNKYMVTDQTAYIGTSNWSGDYFINTAGVAIIIGEPTPSGEDHHHHQAIFERDWYSNYSIGVWNVDVNNFTISCNSA